MFAMGADSDALGLRKDFNICSHYARWHMAAASGRRLAGENLAYQTRVTLRSPHRRAGAGWSGYPLDHPPASKSNA